MKKLNFVVLLMSILMAMTMLLTSCNESAPSTENRGTPSSESTQCEHHYTSDVTTEATCSKDGVMTFTCSACNDSYTEVIAATGEHNYVSKVTAETTCSKDGVKTFTCSACKNSYTEAIAATGKHNYTSKVTAEATCTKDGVKTFICSMCKDSYTESIAAGHKWTNATCTVPKTCSVCKLTEGEALKHKIEGGKCTRCGIKISVVLYEDSTVKITFKKAEKYKYSNDRVELYFYVENKTGKTLLIQADAVSLNGYSFCDLVMSDAVAANSIGIINLSVEDFDFDFDLVNTESIYSIGGQFRIIDDATWKSYNVVFTNVKLDGTGIGGKPVNFSSDNFLYTDNNCEIYYKSIAKYPYSSDRVELYFYILNKTQKTLLIQADTISINGYSFSNLIMSDPVLPDTMGIINLSVEDFDFDLVDTDNITKIGGQFRIIEDATRKSYVAIFP